MVKDNPILVTGARGFIGRTVTSLLSLRGWAVHATSRSADLEPAPSGRAITWHTVDLLDPSDSARLIAKVRPATVIHLAWQSQNHWNARSNLDWNAATLHLARCFAECGGDRFIGIGSCAEYAWKGCEGSQTPFDEILSRRAPATLYGAAKNATFDALSTFFSGRGIGFVWGVLFHPYGPGDNHRELVSYVVGRLLRGQPALCSSGQQCRDFVYLDDVAEAILALASAKATGRFNIGAGVATPVRDVALRVGELLARPDLIKLGERPNDSHSVVACIDRLTSETSWRPAVSIDEGICRTIRWWRERMDGPGLVCRS